MTARAMIIGLMTTATMMAIATSVTLGAPGQIVGDPQPPTAKPPPPDAGKKKPPKPLPPAAKTPPGTTDKEDAGCGPKPRGPARTVSVKTEGPLPKWSCGKVSVAPAPVWAGTALTGSWTVRNGGPGVLEVQLKGG